MIRILVSLLGTTAMFLLYINYPATWVTTTLYFLSVFIFNSFVWGVKDD